MNKKIKIGRKVIGKGEKTFIIAEAGSNHDGKLDQAKELIDIARDCKVDAVKFQLFKAENFYPKNTKMFNLMKENELPREWLPELFDHAARRGLIFLASPFDEAAIDLLCKLGAGAIKWASSETTNLPLLRYAALKKKPLLISTGMCNLADVYEAVEVVTAAGNNNIALLQCSALYPAKPHDVNLRVMDTLLSAFSLPVGYSDHTLDCAVSAAAVARGACIIEKHFTLSRKLKGPDHSYAVEPAELSELVRTIRDVEACLGSPIKKMLPDEKKYARRESILAGRGLAKGITITDKMIKIGRPAGGIEPRFMKAVIGTKVRKAVKKEMPIGWDMLEAGNGR